MTGSTSFETLRGVDVLSGLTDDDICTVAENACILPVAAGTKIITAGEHSGAIYVLHRGQVAVHMAIGDEPPREVATLGPGDLFGEMSAVTDAPRSATVVAISDADVLEIPEDEVQRILAARPDVAGELLRTLIERQADNMRTLMDGDADLI